MTDPVSPEQPDELAQLASLFQREEAAAKPSDPAKIVPIVEARKRAAEKEGMAGAGSGGEFVEKRGADKKPRIYVPLPHDCPVVPLGVQGSTYYFIDAIGQLVVKDADKMGTNGIDDLFKHSAAQAWADRHFGRIGKGGESNGLDRDLLKRALTAACGDLSERGTFNPMETVRSTGAWTDELRRLVWHCGGFVLTSDADGGLHKGKPGQRDGYVYPLGDPQMAPGPIDEAIAGPQGPGAELLQLLQKWFWVRPDVDPFLMLGWLMCAPVGGALDWRPACWLTGDSSTGKSTLQELIKLMLGKGGLVQAFEATGASVWQSVGHRSLPVAIDELEAEADNSRRAQLITLMRGAASGGRIMRGGADGKASEFIARNCFLFSSILMLPLPPQDLNRLCVLGLNEIPKGSTRPLLDVKRLAAIGAALRRRISLQWPRWQEHLSPWHDPINKEFGLRTADTFATLLAMAHIALADEPAHPDVVEEQIASLIPSLREWATISGRDHELMLSHLGTWQLEPWDRGQRHTVRQLVYWASRRSKDRTDPQHQVLYGKELHQPRTRAALVQHGLKVVELRAGVGDKSEYLAIAFRHSSLEKIFRGTKWQGGVWRQSAGRVPGAQGRKVRLGAGAEGCTLVPLDAILGEQEDLTAPEQGTS
jgi:hypothetical protein